MLFTILFAYPAAKEFRKRRFYQVLTDRFATSNQKACKNLRHYCGGDYKGMISKLDYIKDLGYNGIWISPTVAQAENNNGAYHGYWFSDFYASNPRFGTDQDLKNLVKEAHKRDIYVISDVVYNHVGGCSGGRNDFSCIKTFPKAEYYHDDCEINDYNNEW